MDVELGQTCIRAEIPRSQAEALHIEPSLTVTAAIPPQAVHVFD